MNYRGNALTWQNGRQLASYGSNTYAYNADGLRIAKTVNGVKTEYILNGSQVMRQVSGSWVADYLYHENGTPLAFAYCTVGGTVGYNLYAYCNNNPVMYVDPTGNTCICLYERVHPKHKCKDLLVEVNSTQDYSEYCKASAALRNTIVKPQKRSKDSSLNMLGKEYFVVDASIDLRYSKNHLTGKALDYYAELLYHQSIEFLAKRAFD